MVDLTADEAYEEFCKQDELFEPNDFNEANTRLRIIDTILFDVLKWIKKDVDVEQYCKSIGYADYVFGHDENILLVLEAKRTGKWFVLPKNKISKANPIGFKLLASECPDAETALRQAVGYAAGLGAKYVAISNGHQWIFTLTYVVNQKLDDRSVFVFESFDALKTGKFREFFECFSPVGLETNLPADKLIETRKLPAPPKLSSSITNYPRLADRNKSVNEIYIATSSVWNEVKNDEITEEFLGKCYVTTPHTNQLFDQATELISSRLSADERQRVDVTDASNFTSVIKHELAQKPVVILGKVGHGKTTFLRYLRQIKAKKLLENYIQIDVDFVDRPDHPHEVSGFVEQAVAHQLLERHAINISDKNLVRGFLHKDLETNFKPSYEGLMHEPGSIGYKANEAKFVSDIRACPHEYLKRVFAHLKRGQKKSIVIFLDNLDRRSDALQEEAFLKASAIARDWSILVFVCLRPGTFYRSSHFGVLDSVAPKVIRIGSPKTKALVKRRLNYAIGVAKGLIASTRVKAGVPFSGSTSFVLPKTAELLGVVRDSFVERRDLCELFEAVSNGNARELLRQLIQSIRSGHLDTLKILRILDESGQYTIAEHEAIRTLLFGDYLDYDPSVSSFINLFDVTRADPSEHFSRLLLLTHLSNVTVGHPAYGFMPVYDLHQYLFQMGFSQSHIEETCTYLYEKQCIDSKLPYESWSGEIDSVRITSKGRYLVTNLIFVFDYFNAVVADTPILDDSVRSEIRDVSGIHDRLDRVDVFVAYLKDCTKSIQDSHFEKTWTRIETGVSAKIDRIRETLSRSKSK